MKENFKEFMIKHYVDTLNVKMRLEMDVQAVLAKDWQNPPTIQVEFRPVFCPTRVDYSEGYGWGGVTLIYPKVKDFTIKDANKWFEDNGFTKAKGNRVGWVLEY